MPMSTQDKINKSMARLSMAELRELKDLLVPRWYCRWLYKLGFKGTAVALNQWLWK